MDAFTSSPAMLIIRRGLIPATLELMDKRMMAAVEQFAAAGLPLEASAVLILETDGFPESVGPQMDEIIEVIKECGVHTMRIAQNEAEREKPCGKYPWDGVRNVRPFSRFASTVVEGVY